MASSAPTASAAASAAAATTTTATTSHHVHIVPTADGAAKHLKAFMQHLAGSESLVKVTCDADDIPATTTLLIQGRPSIKTLEGCPSLHTLVIPWAGLPDETRDMLLKTYAEWKEAGSGRAPLRLFNLHNNAAATAEMALTLLLSAMKRVRVGDQALRSGDWRPRYDGGMQVPTVAGSRVCIVGLGAIGRRVAAMLLAFGASEVRATKRCIAGSTGVELVWVTQDGGARTAKQAASLGVVGNVACYEASQLDKALEGADIVVVTCPLTTSTKGCIGAPQLALLTPGATLVNVGRGLVVDEAALYEALAGTPTSPPTLGAAGIDVWYNYPDTKESRANTQQNLPFHKLENIVMSPHRGGKMANNGLHRMTAAGALTAAVLAHDDAQVAAALAKAPPTAVPRPVSLEEGY